MSHISLICSVAPDDKLQVVRSQADTIAVRIGGHLGPSILFDDATFARFCETLNAFANMPGITAVVREAS